jgi:DNA-binding NarL/FixJ family response regulator
MRLSQQSREAAVIEERDRMARDIHDTLAQGFTGVIVQLEAAKGAVARRDFADIVTRIERASELAKSSLREARRSVIAAKLSERLHADGLTPRESEVLGLLARGKPNKLIGAALFVSEVTVKSHVQSIFRKLNVLSRTEAIAVATRKGLLRSLAD